MTDGISIKVDASRFARELKSFGKEFEIKAVNAGTRVAATIFKKAVIDKAPRLAYGTKWRVSGQLQKAVYAKKSKRSTSGAIRYYVGIRASRKDQKKKRDAFYWYFLEHGWQPRGRKGKLKGGERSRALQRKRNLAAGGKQVRYQFIEPAFRAAQAKATQAFEKTITRYLAKANKK